MDGIVSYVRGGSNTVMRICLIHLQSVQRKYICITGIAIHPFRQIDICVEQKTVKRWFLSIHACGLGNVQYVELLDFVLILFITLTLFIFINVDEFIFGLFFIQCLSFKLYFIQNVFCFSFCKRSNCIHPGQLSYSGGVATATPVISGFCVNNKDCDNYTLLGRWDAT